MIKTYIKSAIRNCRRQPLYTIINISGLALGIACVILCYLWVKHHINYDKFHENIDDIYQINVEVYWGPEPWIQTNHQSALAPELKRRYPEIKDITRISYTGNVVFNCNEKLMYEHGIVFVDSSFFKIFTFPLIQGSSEEIFSSPRSILFTESMAKKYFGNEDPIGKTIKFNNYVLKIVGVVKDSPPNSTIGFNYILSTAFLKEFRNNPNFDNNWDSWYLYSYLTFKENTDIEAFKSKIEPLFKDFEHIKPENKVLIHPFKKRHLEPLRLNYSGIGLLEYLYIVSFIALVILIIACVNFMNLSTACFSGRAKEVGIRKTVGAKRKYLIRQFFTESVILAFTGGIISIFIVKLVLPFFSQLVSEQLQFQIFDIQFLLILFSIIVFCGFLSGTYPSLYLSSFKPVKVLKGRLVNEKGKNYTRRILVIGQFSLSILFIIGTLTTIKQLKYTLNADLGFDKEHVLYVNLNDATNYHTLKQELLKNPDIESVTAADWWGFNSLTNSYGYDFPGKKPDFDVLLSYQMVDFDYLKTLNVQLKEGRDFSRQHKEDKNQNFILNETAIKVFDIENPVGSEFSMHGRRGKIIGVMKDIHFRSLNNPIEPRIIWITKSELSNVLIKIKANQSSGLSRSLPEIINGIQNDWNKVLPDCPFDYSFIDDMYNSTYQGGRILSRIFSVLAILAIFISCLGLFGLATYSIEQKIKEIGIRKTNGAKVSQVVIMFTLEFTKYVIIAYIIIAPLAYYFMNKWLNNYPYRTEMSWWIFLTAGAAAMIIAILTVCGQSWRAANRNPVEALRYE